MVRAVLLRKKNFLQRLDILPFLILYPILFYPMVTHIQEAWIEEEPDSPTNSTFAFIFDHVDTDRLQSYTFQVTFPIFFVLAHIVLLLLPYWSVKMQKILHYTESDEPHATHVVFFPQKHHGSAGIVPYHHSTKDHPKPYAIFQEKRREYYDGEFHSLKYPTHLPLIEYSRSKGLTSVEAAQRLLYYGENTYHMPIPSYFELLIQYIRSPLFVIQVFNNLIYLLNEYLETTLTNIIMYVVTSSANIRTRQNNLLELRGVESPPVQLYVCRSGTWTKISSNFVVPGDKVLITREMPSPFDFVLVSGRAVCNESSLTGEATPQLKEPLEPSTEQIANHTPLDQIAHRTSVIFGGTTIEQLLPDSNQNSLPESGVEGIVLSTGLGSSQGRLIRTILFSSENKLDNKDSLYLMGFLTICTIVASIYLWITGRHSGNITTFRLILEILYIWTVTIPVDLPMSMNFSLNSSLLALTKLKLYCTEPFRISLAGQVSVCCFDKTGTLTADEYNLIGVDDLSDSRPPSSVHDRSEISGRYFFPQPLKTSNPEYDIPLRALEVIGGCHSLVRGNYGRLIGDQIERSGLTGIRGKLTGNGVEHPLFNLTTTRIFHFSSELRRMSVVAHIREASGSNGYYVLAKGAPDTIDSLLREVPEHYHETYRSYTRQGCRVMALAYKRIEKPSADYTRDNAENDLEFAGFVIFSAAIKRGTEDSIVNLLKSMHRIVIITGDDPLTAMHVATRLHIAVRPPAIHDWDRSANCEHIEDEHGETLSATDANSSNYFQCYTGRAFAQLSGEKLDDVVLHCNVFARMSPQQKSQVVIKLEDLGYNVLMCGDGTNDVAALKQAECGVGLIDESAENLESTSKNPIANPAAKQENEGLEEGSSMQTGAASIASPFVSKRPTISGTVDLIRWGRATLSSTLDLFKQLSLNSLISCYTMSVLAAENVRSGSRQQWIFTIVMMIAELSITWAKPRRKLSKERPFIGQFNGYMISSVLSQFTCHVTFMNLTRHLVYRSGYVPSKYNANARFTPNLLNTATFIMKSEMEIITILWNYRGAPFMQSLRENTMLLLGTVLASAVVVLMLFDPSPKIAKLIQLVQFPSLKFQITLAVYCVLDALLSLLCEKICLRIFERRDQKKTEGLVEPQVLEQIKDYITNDDDILPSELYEFGMMEMLKQNVMMQNEIKMKNRERDIRERKKKELANKAMNEAQAALNKK